MAERRMFSKAIIDSDAFLEMPLSTQALYFHLGMRADDDGFVSSPNKIMRMIGSSPDELKILTSKKFLLEFDNGIVVVKHWKINNYIRNDRYTPTVYTKEKQMLTEKDNKAYQLSTTCQPLGIPMVDAGKVSIDKIRKDKSNIVIDVNPKDVTELEKTIEEFKKHRKQMKSPMTDRAVELLLMKLEKMADNDEDKIKILNQSIEHGWKGVFELKDKSSQSSHKVITGSDVEYEYY